MKLSKNYLLILVLILVLAFLLRWINFQQMKTNNPIFDIPIVDAKEYVDNATYCINKTWLGPPGSYFHPPVYFYFIALMFKIFGESIDIIKIFQIIIDLINISLIYLIAQKIFNRQIATVSIILYAMYIPIIQFSIEILPPILIIFLLLVSVLSLLYLKESQKSKKLNLYWLVISSMSFGFLVITLPNFLLCLPFILIWQLKYFKNIKLRTRTKFIFLYLIISLTPTIFVTLRNYSAANELVLISYNGGINFYIGNNQDIYKTVSIRPGMEYEKLSMYPLTQKRITNFAEQSNFWYKKGFGFILSHPIDWIWLMIKKTILFFNSYEFPRNFDLSFFRQYSSVTKLPIIKFNIILPLSLSAIFFLCFNISSIGKREAAMLLFALIFSYSFSIILIFIASRYRVPIIPFLMIFSAYYIVILINKFIHKEYFNFLKLMLLAIVFAIFTQIKFFTNSYPYKINASATYSLIGDELLERKRISEAYYFFQKGLQLPVDETTYNLYHSIGYYYYRVGNEHKAIEYFRKSVELNPTNYRAFNSLGFLYKMRGEYDIAIDYLNKAKEIAKCYPEVYLNLADCYIGQNDWNKVILILESYGDICPSPSPIINHYLGRFYMDLFQDWQKALKHFENAIKYPQGEEISPETSDRLGSCYYNLNELEKAKVTWLKGLKIDPNYQPIKTHLLLLE